MNVSELQKKGYQFAHVPRAKHLEDEYTHRDLFGTCRGKCTQCDCKQYVKETAAYTIQPGQEGRKHPHNDPDITNCSRCSCPPECHEIDEASNEKEHGNDNFQLGRYDEAILRYTRGIEYRPSDETIWSNRSAAYLAKGLYREALHDAKRAAQIKPDWAKARARKAMAHLCLKEYEDSISEYKLCVKLDPANEVYANSLKSAKKEYEKHWDPKRRANEAMNAGCFDRAIALYTEIYSKDPKNYQIISNRSAAYAKAKMYVEALEDANAVVKLAPRWPKGWSRKGLALYYMKRYDEAIQCYEQALRFDPGNKNIKQSLKDTKTQAQRAMNDFVESEIPKRGHVDRPLSHKYSNTSEATDNSVECRLTAIEEKLELLCAQSENISLIVNYLKRFEPFILAEEGKFNAKGPDLVADIASNSDSTVYDANTAEIPVSNANLSEETCKASASVVLEDQATVLGKESIEDLCNGKQGSDTSASASADDNVSDNSSNSGGPLHDHVEEAISHEGDNVYNLEESHKEDIDNIDTEGFVCDDSLRSASNSSTIKAEDIFSIFKDDNHNAKEDYVQDNKVEKTMGHEAQNGFNVEEVHEEDVDIDSEAVASDGIDSNDSLRSASNNSTLKAEDIFSIFQDDNHKEREKNEQGIRADALDEEPLKEKSSNILTPDQETIQSKIAKGTSEMSNAEVPVESIAKTSTTVKAEDIFSICNTRLANGRKKNAITDNKEVDNVNPSTTGESQHRDRDKHLNSNQILEGKIISDVTESVPTSLENAEIFGEKATAAACKIFDNIWSTLDDDEDNERDDKDEDDGDMNDERWYELEAEWAEVKNFCDANRDFIKPPFREKRKFYETVRPPPAEENAVSKLNIGNLTKSIQESAKKSLEKDWFGVKRGKCKLCESSVCNSFRPSFPGSAPPSYVYERAIKENNQTLLDFALQWNNHPVGRYCLNCGCDASDHETEEEVLYREKVEAALVSKKKQVEKNRAYLKSKIELECRQRVIDAAQRKKAAEENGEFIRESCLDFITQMRRGPCSKSSHCPGFKVYFRESDALKAEVMLYCSLCGYPSEDHPVDTQWADEQQRKRHEEKQQSQSKRKSIPAWKMSKYNEAHRSACRLLGVHEDATSMQINKAYKKLALKYHPDKNSSPRAQELFVRVTQAFQLLHN